MKIKTLISVLGMLLPILSVKAQTIKGRVSAATGEALPHATLLLKNTHTLIPIDNNGYFSFLLDKSDSLYVSYTGYQTQILAVTSKDTFLNIQLRPVSDLDEVIIQAYGTTTRRLNTGDISIVTSSEIEKQPVGNILAALEGRVPGLLITQSSGVPGSGFQVQLRGQGSIAQGSDPLIIIDGVPFSAGITALNSLPSAAGYGTSTASDGISPMNLINPADIESIEVLKDADATAIYGSRGANGVILVTTKKSRDGHSVLTLGMYSGISKKGRALRMLNTSDYRAMRYEAFRNDGVEPEASNAPDLLIWDSTRYTDFSKLLTGSTAHTTDGQVSLSFGDTYTQVVIAGGIHRETTVFPGKKGDRKASTRFSLTHASHDNLLRVSASAFYVSEHSNLLATDLSSYINTAPNILLRDSTGKLMWGENGVSYLSQGLLNANPLAFQYQPYNGRFDNLVGNIQLSFEPIRKLFFKVNAGYNLLRSDEIGTYPSTSLDPNLGQLPYSYFGNASKKSWVVEPQLEYAFTLGPGKLHALAGNTWQENTMGNTFVQAYDYSSDLLLESIAAASYNQTTNNTSTYRYTGLYGRLNYNIDNRYILNLSGRRDGSSRFATVHRFSNFTAAGAAWIFSATPWFREALPAFNFGKLRASYGVTGNDQIGDYRYLDLWTSGSNTYMGNPTLKPSSLYNPDYGWERNRKLEMGLEFGLFQSRVTGTVSYYTQKSDNQLVNYTLPAQTGFSSVLENLNATIRNTGWEVMVNSKNIDNGQLQWRTAFNITFPRNRLLSFPGLENSSYAGSYAIGHPLSASPLYHYLGVNEETGIYQFEDVNGDGAYTMADRIVIKGPETKAFGGLSNDLQYGHWNLSCMFEFRWQQGYNYLHTLGGTPPGYSYFNQPAIVLSRWQKNGDKTNIQRFSATDDDIIGMATNYLIGSDAIISDASFARLKNVNISFSLPDYWNKKLQMKSARIYLQAQNIFTITGYRGGDPENQNIYVLPPLKTVVLGIQVNL